MRTYLFSLIYVLCLSHSPLPEKCPTTLFMGIILLKTVCHFLVASVAIFFCPPRVFVGWLEMVFPESLGSITCPATLPASQMGEKPPGKSVHPREGEKSPGLAWHAPSVSGHGHWSSPPCCPLMSFSSWPGVCLSPFTHLHLMLGSFSYDLQWVYYSSQVTMTSAKGK